MTDAQREAEAVAILHRIDDTETGNALMVFFDRHDEVQFVEANQNDEAVIRLHDQAGHSRPYLEICTLINGELTDSTADELLLLPWTLGDITQAVTAARAERVRFYTERAEVYGAAAFPRV